MNSEGDEKIKPFRFVKRKLSVHYSIINTISPKKSGIPNDKTPSPRKHKTMKEQENSVKKKKKFIIKIEKGLYTIKNMI